MCCIGSRLCFWLTTAMRASQRERAGWPRFPRALSGRGLAVGDYDNDGGIDIALTRLNDTPVLLRNNIGHEKNWIGIELQGTKSNRDAIGARLTLTAGARKLVRGLRVVQAICSRTDRRVLYGLGDAPAGPMQLDVRWPNGMCKP